MYAIIVNGNTYVRLNLVKPKFISVIIEITSTKFNSPKRSFNIFFLLLSPINSVDKNKGTANTTNQDHVIFSFNE